MTERQRVREKIIETWIDAVEWREAVGQIVQWAEGRESRFVTICNVHSVVTARGDERLRNAINLSDLATPDGMPVAWLIRRRIGREQPRVNGPDLTIRLCSEAEKLGIPVAFYGSQPETLTKLRDELARQFPALRIGAMISPPYRELALSEQTQFLTQLNESAAGIVFVGLGCPKQEAWMAEHRNDLQGVLVGVGAAFDYIAGTVKRPPVWMQRAGLEWLGRLFAEPRRLWRRYLVTNTIYILYVGREILLPKRHNNDN